MTGIDCMRLGRVVFQVNLRQIALFGAKNFLLIFEVVLGCLVDDEVEFQVPHLL